MPYLTTIHAPIDDPVLHPCFNMAGTGKVTGKAATISWVLRDPSQNDETGTGTTGSVTITEQGATGYYGFAIAGASFDELGVWELQVTNPSGTDTGTYYYYVHVLSPTSLSRVAGAAGGAQDPQIVWTPAGAVSASTLNFPYSFQALAGGRVVDRALKFTVGRKAKSVIGSVYDAFQVTFRGFGSIADANFFSKLSAWASHAQRGGEFSLAVDRSKTYDTTLSGNEAEAQTVLSITSTTGMAAGDFVLIEDVDDPSLYEVAEIASVDSGVQITLVAADALTRPYNSGSVVRFWRYFPKAHITAGAAPYSLRPAGKGVERYDLAMNVQTAR